MAREKGSKVVMPKDWWQSRTMWLNIVSGLVAVAAALKGAELGLPSMWLEILTAIVVIGNALLRLDTDSPIKR